METCVALFAPTQSRREDTRQTLDDPSGLVRQGITLEVSTIREPGEWLLASRPFRYRRRS
jgi:hypothetical protein